MLSAIKKKNESKRFTNISIFFLRSLLHIMVWYGIWHNADFNYTYFKVDQVKTGD